MKLTNKEINGLKQEVKEATGRNIKDIEEITSFSDSELTYGFYETNYDKATNHLSYNTIKRQ